MAERIRFHLDENINPAVALALRARGVDITSTPEAGLLGQGDDRQLGFAMEQGRVLVTIDADFLRLGQVLTAHPGILYFGPKCRTIGLQIQSLNLVWEIMSPAEMAGHIEYL